MAARRRNDITVTIEGEAEFGRARKEIARDLDRIEKDAKDTAQDIERAFDRVDLSPELDTTEIRQALDLAGRLDGMVANLTVDTDLSEIQEAEKIARALRSFQGRVDLTVEGRAELKDALGLAEQMDQIRRVKVQVQGREDLAKAQQLADDLERPRTVPVEVDERDLSGIADAVGGVDLSNVGASLAGQLSGALSAAGPWAAAAAGVAGVFGDDLIDGFNRGFTARRAEFVRSIQSGLSSDDLGKAGRAAGAAYADGFGEGFAEVQATADTVQSILGDFEGFDLTETTKQFQVLSDLLGVEVPDGAVKAARLIRQGLVDDVGGALDLLIGSTREFGDTGIEALDVVSEFGGNFQRFGVEGDDAVTLVATAFRTGLTPTIDRAGESFEEFQTRIADGDAEDAIRSLGLNFQQLQQDVAAGGDRANRAFQQVVEALIATDDQAKLNAASNAIFGTSIEQVSDRAEYLELIMAALTGELGDYAGQAEEVARLNEEAVSGFERLQRKAEDVASVIGGDVDRQMGQLADVLEAAGDAVDRGVSSFTDWLGITDDAADGTGRLSEELSTSSIRARDAADGFSDVADTASDASDEITDMADSVAQLEAEFSALFNFAPDQVLRAIYDEALRLAEALDSDAAAAVGLNGSIDVTTEAGRNLQAQMERVSGAVQDNAQALIEGKIKADQWTTGQRAAESAIREAGRAAGLTQSQIQGLVDKYAKVPPSVKTIITAEDQTSSILSGIQSRLNALKAGVTVPVRATSTVSSNVSALGVNRRASGGETTGLTLVGEEGPELVDFGEQSAYVHDAAETRRMLGNSPAGRAFMTATPVAPPAGGGRVVLEINSGGSALDDLLVEMLRKAVRNRGGGVEAVLG